jgi:hypothetical protein
VRQTDILCPAARKRNGLRGVHYFICAHRRCRLYLSAMSRLSDASFTARICCDWARRMGIHFDLNCLAVRTVADEGFTGRGVFLARPAEPGEVFAIIPESATLRAPDLGLSTRRYFADLATVPAPPLAPPTTSTYLCDSDAMGSGLAGVTMKAESQAEAAMAEAFGRGFQVVARGADSPLDDLPVVGLLDTTQPTVTSPETVGPHDSFLKTSLPPLTSEERDWWQLAMVLALERRRGTASPWLDYLQYALPQSYMMDVSACLQRQMPLLMKGRMPSPETTMKPPSRNESPLIAPLTPKDFTAMRQQVFLMEQTRNGYAWRFAALFNRNLQSVAASRAYTSLERPTLLRPSDLRWAMDMVTSRANNFSFFQCTDRPRPYGLSPDPVPGTASTLCPFFDLLNHSAEMNVLVADVRLGSHSETSAQDDGAIHNPDDLWTKPQPLSTAGLVIGSLGKIAAGEELCYVYNAPTKRDESTGHRHVDVAAAIARWGFLPPPPLT